ncbi:hypothetical protein [Burkholderia gladioli]|uniref:hypothetical protein n=1 Tax=Burkholderia gladioli TaxID=28095 RepID=UPI0026539758|nr:hypothetical protein [Burkholderia gladioli]MDN7466228.1 hypothetical protein [Burkholderia gladioli]
MTNHTEPSNTHCKLCHTEFTRGDIITTYLTWSAGAPGFEQRAHLHCAVEFSREQAARHQAGGSTDRSAPGDASQ